VQTSDAQVRKLMEEITKHGQVGRASLKANMDRKTGRKYVAAGKLPSEMIKPRTGERTRVDPFAEDWPAIAEKLKETPEFEAKTIFEELMERHPGRYVEGQLRTLQRHIRGWRATEGPDKEVFFSQLHRPGEAAQTDFTWATKLGVTIAGAAFVHMLCVFTLPFSNFQWLTVCLSESMMAIRRGVQSALFRLGRAPRFHQTDHSTAATHKIPTGAASAELAVKTTSEDRQFNDEYVALMRHFAMTPRTIAIAASEQNGDVEASNGAIKRRLEQALLRRGHRDFDTREEWEKFAQDVVDKANRRRTDKIATELAAMQLVNVVRLAEFNELDVGVTAWSTIHVARNTYSVPSRLIGEEVKAHVYEDRIEVFFAQKHQLTVGRLRGDGGHRINYRHIIWSLVQKPGAFARYRYREELFPSLTFRKSYDAIQMPDRGTRGDLDYLKILHLAASTMESEVEAALSLLLAEAAPPSADAVRALIATTTSTPICVPALEPPVVDLDAYDELLTCRAVAS
jgi:hypothetical protein